MSEENLVFPSSDLPKIENMFSTSENTFNWKLSLVRAEIRSIREYIDAVSSGFEREYDAFDKKVAEEAKRISPDHHEIHYEDAAGTAFDLSEHFPEFAWQTTFVAIYSFLEVSMIDIANDLGPYLGVEVELDELRSDGIFAAKLYLAKLCHLPFPEGSHAWQEVCHFNKIRNAIVHSRGNLNRANKSKEIMKYAEGKTSIKIESGILKLSKEFCINALDDVRTLLDTLFVLSRAKRVEKKLKMKEMGKVKVEACPNSSSLPKSPS